MNEQIECKLLAFAENEMQQDQAHDINHVLRVVKTAKKLCDDEKAKLEVVLPAAYLHDCFSFAKNHPDKASSSKFAADKAIEFLQTINYPSNYFSEIKHAITAHSYSANINPETLEAQIVQDADRLDALGAIGIARCLQVSGALDRTLYNSADPFCKQRLPDDSHYTIDHFYAKLFKLPEQMKTKSAKMEAQRRVEFMQAYLSRLDKEI